MTLLIDAFDAAIAFYQIFGLWSIFYVNPLNILFCLFLFIRVFFHEHSWFTRQQGRREGTDSTPLYQFHPTYGHIDISREIAAGSSPLCIASSRTRTGNLWFPSEDLSLIYLRLVRNNYWQLYKNKSNILPPQFHRRI